MDVTAITSVTAFVGERLDAIDDATVVMEGRRIAAVGPSDEIDIPVGARRLDMAGHVLTPGFIDAHVHIGFYEPHEVVARGVTTVRDLGWPPEKIFPLAEASAEDSFDGPTILAAGPMLTAPRGYPSRAAWAPNGTALELAAPAEARRALEQLATRSAVVKIALDPRAGPVLDDDTLGAIVAAAHESGLKVTGHMAGLDQLERALDAGVDELAHMLMSPESIPTPVIARMVESAMTVVPTLSIFEAGDRSLVVDDLRRFHAAGGTIVYGTDLGNQGPQPGIDLTEVRAMAAAGMSLKEIVRAATVAAAGCLGLEHVGSIAAGRDADLVAFRGHLRDGPRLLQTVAAVWRRGRAVI